ncbi:flavin reductase family protein [Azoarcus olearius]|uniref:Probable HPA reductase n=1 Tax=Azoarcus sp. (strain BH72) TaxID=418699 RepID=A1K6V5_AZOSB|nr:flavin reductase family protein [Azoarcus olearius]CAL94560.1 probable HPA reductase [Azoarcus olearius]
MSSAVLEAPLSAEAFRRGMRRLALPTAVVTTAHDGERGGLTVSSLCSVSTDPPRLLVCINTAASAFPLLRASGVLAVNMLAEGQGALCMRFGSSRCSGEARFAEGRWETARTGAPLLADALASFDCRVVEMHESATHAIVIADVVELRTAPDAMPLLYRDGAFARLHMEAAP